MKYLISLFILLSSLTSSAQDPVGVYQLKSGSKVSNGFELKRILTLHADGTFEYYNYRYVEKGVPKETYLYGKGLWKIDKKIIVFSSESSDLDEKFTLDFNGTKARFISKSSRDKSDRVIETSIRIFESDIPWITGMTLIKSN